MEKSAASHAIFLSLLKPGGWNVFRLDENLSVIVLYDGENIKVVHDFCPHMGGPLSQGQLCKTTKAIVCPWHGYHYSSQTLSIMENPNESIWIKPLAGDQSKVFETPKYKLRELPFRKEGDQIIIETG